MNHDQDALAAVSVPRAGFPLLRFASSSSSTYHAPSHPRSLNGNISTGHMRQKERRTVIVKSAHPVPNYLFADRYTV